MNVATLNALIKRGLIQVDTTTSLYQGQRLHVTAEGRRALVQHRPATTPARTAAVTPPATKQAAVGRTR
ncbi:hypothetical protein AB0D38_21780 [Streptomyces sp. NPDC048279]|uniref:hypothetical protein n=1 Tax=Streptomyces sp. NPDC048279 TaxID=3154714 RepID=UPI00342B8A34